MNGSIKTTSIHNPPQPIGESEELVAQNRRRNIRQNIPYEGNRT